MEPDSTAINGFPHFRIVVVDLQHVVRPLFVLSYWNPYMFRQPVTCKRSTVQFPAQSLPTDSHHSSDNTFASTGPSNYRLNARVPFSGHSGAVASSPNNPRMLLQHRRRRSAFVQNHMMNQCLVAFFDEWFELKQRLWLISMR